MIAHHLSGRTQASKCRHSAAFERRLIQAERLRWARLAERHIAYARTAVDLTIKELQRKSQDRAHARRDRTWQRCMHALTNTHAQWLATLRSDPQEWRLACRNYAQAAHNLLVHLVGPHRASLAIEKPEGIDRGAVHPKVTGNSRPTEADIVFESGPYWVLDKAMRGFEIYFAAHGSTHSQRVAIVGLGPGLGFGYAKRQAERLHAKLAYEQLGMTRPSARANQCALQAVLAG